LPHSLNTSPNRSASRPLVTIDKTRHCRVIGHQIASDHPVGHILATVTLDRARRAHTGRERIQHKRHHQRRLIRPAMTIGPIDRIERAQIHALDHADHKPRQVIRRKPLPHVQRQQNPCSRLLSMKFCGIPTFH